MTIGLRSTNRSDLSYSTRGDDIPTGEVILFYADTYSILCRHCSDRLHSKSWYER